MDKIFLPAVVGPTASGKTALCVEICLRLSGEAVCADSMQIYKGMSIATAKPTEEEMRGVPHHMCNFLDPSERFSAAQYRERAQAAVADIAGRGKLPVLCGGTGLYVNALVDGFAFEDADDNLELRHELARQAENGGAEELYARLAALDPAAAEQIHINNKKRVVRALEYYLTHGRSILVQRARTEAEKSPYAPCFIGLTVRNRQFLYDRINRRVDEMLKNGLLEEAEIYRSLNAPTAAQAIGYKELKPYFEGTSTLGEAVESLKRETRRYAKRQLTWFGRDERVKWLYIDETPGFEELVGQARKIIGEELKTFEREQQQQHRQK